MSIPHSVMIAPPPFRGLAKRPPRVARRVIAAGTPLGPGEMAQVRKAIQQAQKTCRDTTDMVECAIAWDEVDEVARGLAQRQWAQTAPAQVAAGRHQDPLEAYCHDFPETEECRAYDS